MKKEKLEYELVDLKLVLLDCRDLITTSGNGDMEFEGESGTPSDGWT